MAPNHPWASQSSANQPWVSWGETHLEVCAPLASIPSLLGASWQALISRWIFGDPKIAKNLNLGTEDVSVGSGNFTFFRAFRKKFPRGPEDGFCGFECFRTSKISGYFRELNKIDVDVYKSPGCFAALRRYPCLRVQSSIINIYNNVSS